MEGHIWFAFIYCCSLAVCIYILSLLAVSIKGVNGKATECAVP